MDFLVLVAYEGERHEDAIPRAIFTSAEKLKQFIVDQSKRDPGTLVLYKFEANNVSKFSPDPVEIISWADEDDNADDEDENYQTYNRKKKTNKENIEYYDHGGNVILLDELIIRLKNTVVE